MPIGFPLDSVAGKDRAELESPNVEVTGAARLYRAASLRTAGLVFALVLNLCGFNCFDLAFPLGYIPGVVAC